MRQISEHCEVNDSIFTMFLGDKKKQFANAYMLEDGIKNFVADCENFSQVHSSLDSFTIESTCFPV